MVDSKEFLGKKQMKDVVQKINPLETKAWELISPIFHYKEKSKGDYFIHEGIYNDSIAFIIKGAMRTYYIAENGTEYNKTFFIENSFAVSLASALTHKAGYLNFQFLEDSCILITKFSQIMQLYPRFRSIETLVRKVIEYEWVIKKEQREIQLVTQNATERYLQFLQDYPGLEQRIPQYHIASNLGITPIQLSRIRAKKIIQ